MRALVVLPTYNECQTVSKLLPLIRRQALRPEVLVVDSNSPDGTAGVVRAVAAKDPGIHLIEQKQKQGIGRAYMDGLRWAAARDYDCVATMDADFSHNPVHLDAMFAAARDHDFVVGSRYVSEGGIKRWPLGRRMISGMTNFISRTLLGLPVRDLTGGFNVMRPGVVKNILEHKIEAAGFAWQIETKLVAHRKGASLCEVPIVFRRRARGRSKLSVMIILEAVGFILRHALRGRHFRPGTLAAFS